MRAVDINGFVGKYVSIKFERDYIDNYRDPSDSDSWVCEGYLAKQNTCNRYLLVFHPEQYEYKVLGEEHINDAMEEIDIASIILFNLTGNPS